jgi:hypothetical protein
MLKNCSWFKMCFEKYIWSLLIKKIIVKIIAWLFYAFLRHLQVLFLLILFNASNYIFKQCIIEIIIHSPNSLSQLEEIHETNHYFHCGGKGAVPYFHQLRLNKNGKIYFSVCKIENYGVEKLNSGRQFILSCHICNQQNYSYLQWVWTS